MINLHTALAVMLFITPMPVIPAVMLVHSILGAVWESTPGWLIPSLIGTLPPSRVFPVFPPRGPAGIDFLLVGQAF
jgi:hypothetical protein